MTKIYIYISTAICLLILSILPVKAQDKEKPYKEKLVLIDKSLKQGDLQSAVQMIDEVLAENPDADEVFYTKALLFGQLRDIKTAVEAARSAYQLDRNNLLYAQYLLDLYKNLPDYVSALALVNDLLVQHPTSLRLYNEKILLYHNSKQPEMALKSYEEAVRKIGSSDTLDVLKAEILVDLKRYDEAKQLLLGAVQEGSSLRQTYSTLSFIYVEEKKAKKAVEILEAGIRKTQEDILYLDLADAYNAINKYPSALSSLKTAFRSDGVDYLDKHRVMLNVLNGKNNFSDSQKEELVNELLLKYPRIAENHIFKGDILWQQNKLSEARSVYLTAIGINPSHMDGWRKLVNVEIGMKDYASAIAHGHEAMQIIPNNAVLNYFTALAYLLKKEMNFARHYLEQALNFSGNENNYVQSMIYSSLGDLYHEINMPSASDVAYEEAIKLDKQNASALNNYAYYLSLRKMNLDKAAKYSKMAIEIDQKSGTFQDTYAWILFQQENYSEALIWIQKAVKNSEPSSVVFEHYGDILYKNGKQKEAVKQWKRALELESGEDARSDKLKLKISEKKYID